MSLKIHLQSHIAAFNPQHGLIAHCYSQDICNGRGIWLFDRGFDSRILIQAFLKLGIRFSIRINASRNIWPEPFQKAGCQKKEKILLEKLLKTISYPFSMTIPISSVQLLMRS